MFNVYIEFAHREASPDTYSTLFDALITLSPAVGPATNGNLSLRLFVEADSRQHALTQGLEAARTAVASCEISPDTITTVEVLTEGEFDRREALPAIPELAGTAEAAAIIGISEDGLQQLLPELEQHLVQRLASGPVYLASGVEQVRDDHQLSPAEQALLDVLDAAARNTHLPVGTPDHRLAADAVQQVTGDGLLWIRRSNPTAELTIGDVLDRLVAHNLVRIQDSAAAEAFAGRAHDVLVNFTSKGRRHMAATADRTSEVGR